MAEIPLGLLGFAAGAMQGGRPSQTPLGFGGAFGNALQGGLQNYGLLSQVQNQNTMGQYRQMAMMQDMAQQQEQAKQAAARRAALAEWSQTLPEEQQALAALAPDSFIEARVKNTFETPKPPPTRKRRDGSQEIFEEWDPQTKGYVEISSGPLWAPDRPPAQYRTLTPEEAFNFGLPAGGVYQVNERDNSIRQAAAPGSNGIRYEQDANGNPIITIGGRTQGPGASELTNGATTAVQRQVDELRDQQARLGNIGDFWRPEFQEYAPRAQAAWTALTERLGVEPSPEQQQLLSEFTTAKSSALSFFSEKLNQLSGAAVTASELARAESYLPSVGTGIFDGDSPTQFQSKLNSLQRETRLALARKIYLLKNGIEFDFANDNNGGVSLNDMPRIIDARGEELEAELVAQGVPADQAADQVAGRLREEFGL